MYSKQLRDTRIIWHTNAPAIAWLTDVGWAAGCISGARGRIEIGIDLGDAGAARLGTRWRTAAAAGIARRLLAAISRVYLGSEDVASG